MIRRLLIIAYAAAACLFGQPAFEVAVVRPVGPQARTIGLYTYPGGAIRAENYTLAMLVEEAFDVQAYQITGGPAWIRDTRFELQAKPPAGSKASQSNPSNPKLPMNPEQREMLKALLVERFQLKYRRDVQPGPVYHLTKSNKPLKLVPAKDPDAYPWVGGVHDGIKNGMIMGTGVGGTNAPMTLLATRLSHYLRRPVIDRTGLTGAFDFAIEHSRLDEGDHDPTASILFSIQALGLKLEPARGPVETIVIEQAARPSEN